MVHDGKRVVSIIDWEMAGYYPDFYKFSNIFISSSVIMWSLGEGASTKTVLVTFDRPIFT